MAWDGKDYQDRPELYVETLTEDNVSEIDAAISHFKSLLCLNT